MRNNRTTAVLVASLLALLLSVFPAVAEEEDGQTFDQAAARAQADLEAALEELSALREAIAAEKLPLTRSLSAKESRLVTVRADFEDLSRTLDTRNLDLNNLRTEITARRDEKTYLSNLLDEYVRNFETRVHIAELQRYQDVVEAARLAPDQAGLSPAEVFGLQTEMVDASLDRLLDLVGGATFDGKAVGPDGLVKPVRFALVGPVALYGAEDGSSAGVAEQMLGSLEPNMIPFEEPEFTAAVRGVVDAGNGALPFDPSMGNARKIEETKETIKEHIWKGGPVMVPILLMASAALIVAFIKWYQLARVPSPTEKQLSGLMNAVKQGDYDAARKKAQGIPGPTGEMLRAGVEHIDDPKELVEEVMYEKMLDTRLRLQSYLPFVALAASAAPLLGLLGTVTGMINTFKLITVFGSGDARTLSSGISEALVTTEFGLIVAIPSLLLYAFLSRKARRLTDLMEKTAVSFLNRIIPGREPAPAPTTRPTSPATVEAVAEA